MSSNTRPLVRRSRAQWQHLIDEQHNSKLTQRDFCQQNSIAVSSFCNWKRRLSQEDAAKSPSTEDTNWLSLPEQLYSSSSNWRIELDLGSGLCLRLTQG